MILDQLLEKKDLRIYIKYRILELKQAKLCLANELSTDNSVSLNKKLQQAMVKHTGRIAALRRLKKLLEEDLIKVEAKRMWRPDNHEMGKSQRDQNTD